MRYHFQFLFYLLIFIQTQLRDPKVRKMAELLEKTQSSYFPSFKKTFQDVVTGTLLG